jgi:hypothetical protein
VTDRWGLRYPWRPHGADLPPIPAPPAYRVPAPLSPWGEFAPHPRFLAGNYPRIPAPVGKTAILIHVARLKPVMSAARLSNIF